MNDPRYPTPNTKSIVQPLPGLCKINKKSNMPSTASPTNQPFIDKPKQLAISFKTQQIHNAPGITLNKPVKNNPSHPTTQQCERSRRLTTVSFVCLLLDGQPVSDSYVLNTSWACQQEDRWPAETGTHNAQRMVCTHWPGLRAVWISGTLQRNLAAVAGGRFHVKTVNMSPHGSDQEREAYHRTQQSNLYSAELSLQILKCI